MKPRTVIVYPLSAAEERIVRWFGRLVWTVAVTVLTVLVMASVMIG